MLQIRVIVEPYKIIHRIFRRILHSKTHRVRKANIEFFGSSDSNEKEFVAPNALSEMDVLAIWHNMECGLYYPLWTHPKGYFLIINIYTVKGQRSRLGTHWDAFRLLRVFKSLGFEVYEPILVLTFRNYCKKQ